MDLRHKDEIYDPRLANHVDKDKVNMMMLMMMMMIVVMMMAKLPQFLNFERFSYKIPRCNFDDHTGGRHWN